ncbi:MAG: aminotransferase class I/II-fold pyridoxal phosphate-dependent enzyme [Candidatus Eisenbacteria bacterium]
MTAPQLSAHFQSRKPSSIRLAQIEFSNRNDDTEAVNVAVGNVSLPMHPAMIERMRNLGAKGSPFERGVVMYSPTRGTPECNEAFKNIVGASGCETEDLHVQIMAGGSQAMELVIVGCCGPAGTSERPLMLIDAAYTNYKGFADRVGRATVSIQRTLQADGSFTFPELGEIDAAMKSHRPGALVLIPYDNPTGQLLDRAMMIELAKLCVKHGLWIISDEAYRELYYPEAGEAETGSPVSIWSLTEADVPGITGRRISIETASKVWNACGLRIGALVTDSEEYHRQCIAEATASLCASVPGQYIFGALAHESHADLRKWFAKQRAYYRGMLESFTVGTKERIPGAIVSSPDASIYSVVDFREIAPEGFSALDFVLHCAREGRVDIGGTPYTLLTAPMAGFYSVPPGATNPGRTQMRIAYVETPEKMALVPELLGSLYESYVR